MSLIAGNLGIVQRLLDEHSFTWGIFGGAASHIYGNRRPIKDIDILLVPGTLKHVSQVMKEARRIAQFDGRRIMWSGINLCDDLSVRGVATHYTMRMDGAMSERLRRLPLLGSRVMMLAPEDVIIHKLLQVKQNTEEDKDFSDVQSVIQRQQLDTAYLVKRMQQSNCIAVVQPLLEQMGITFL